MAAMPRDTREYATPTFLDRAMSLSQINLDMLAFGILVVISVIAHLWALDVKAMHHDESIHAWSSWRLYTAAGGFTCAGGRVAASYCYDPVYHGPALYHLTALAYFLFGDGDWQARLPEAVAGILLVASAWMLRPYFGRSGTFIAATLLAFSPSLLYFTRFARHDGLMILWVFWMVMGFFRYLDTARPRYLYLLAIGTALAMATHELYYIVFFLFGTFVLIRILSEILPRRPLMIGLGIALAFVVLIMLWDPMITPKLRAGGLALLFATVLGTGLLMVRVWDSTNILTTRLRNLANHERNTLFVALGLLASIFILSYSNFFTDPRGILDGLYQGLAYWLGSQHEFARGKQPWYYYLMELPVYEPMALLGAIGAAAYLFAWGYARILGPIAALVGALILFNSNMLGGIGIMLGCACILLAAFLLFPTRWRERLMSNPSTTTQSIANPNPMAEPGAPSEAMDTAASKTVETETSLDPTNTPNVNGVETVTLPTAPMPRTWPHLFPLFLAFWFIGALVAFSWAGEKMPWLLVHIALPGNLLAAWALGRMIDFTLACFHSSDRLTPRQIKTRMLLIPAALVMLLIALNVALSGIWSSGNDQTGQAALAQSITPLLIAGLMLFSILSVSQSIGLRPVLTLCGLTIFGLLGIYTIRATWMVVYDHPDTPVEMLIYVQSTPDVPLIAHEIRDLAINQTRNTRSATDPAGGRSMPLIMDNGDRESGEGSLAWPYQWYFRDFQRIENHDADFFRNATADSFQVAEDSKQPDGPKEFAPVVMVATPHVTASTRQALEENYVLQYNSKLNWWFPEGDLTGCDPRVPGYKRFYYSTASVAQAREDTQCDNLDIDTLPYASPFAPLIWPFQSENWQTLKNYLLYRTLPDPLRIDGREMQVWIRKDLTSSSNAGSSSTTGGMVKLVAQAVIGAQGDSVNQLNQPRGIAVDRQGTIYVADLSNNRIQVFGPDGNLVRTIGEFGNSDGQFNEPRGVAVDSQDNLYVADTWNARIQKFDPSGMFLKSWGTGEDIGNGRRATLTDGSEAGNLAAPLGFYGPRAVAVDQQGRVYIADTGNKRVVVTDSEGNYLYQWGHAGSDPGLFNEPIGIAVDTTGKVYVADTWNGRVQVFAPDQAGRINPTPINTWRIPGWQANTYDDPFVAVNSADQLYASIPATNSILELGSSGDTILRWGGQGNDTASLSLPSGVAVGADDQVYVVDRGNNRVLRFKLPELAP